MEIKSKMVTGWATGSSESTRIVKRKRTKKELKHLYPKETVAQKRERRAFEAGAVAMAEAVRRQPFYFDFDVTQEWAFYRDKPKPK